MNQSSEKRLDWLCHIPHSHTSSLSYLLHLSPSSAMRSPVPSMDSRSTNFQKSGLTDYCLYRVPCTSLMFLPLCRTLRCVLLMYTIHNLCCTRDRTIPATAWLDFASAVNFCTSHLATTTSPSALYAMCSPDCGSNNSSNELAEAGPQYSSRSHNLFFRYICDAFSGCTADAGFQTKHP